MAHYAKVLEGKVVKVIVADESFFNTFIDDSPGEWIKCSYNTRGGIHYGQDGNPDGGIALRKNFPGPGYIYDKVKDAFIPPKNSETAVFNEEKCIWEEPPEEPEQALS